MGITACEAVTPVSNTAHQATAVSLSVVESRGSGVSGRATTISAVKSDRQSRRDDSPLAGSCTILAVAACTAGGLQDRDSGRVGRGRRTAIGSLAPICLDCPLRTASKNLLHGGCGNRMVAVSTFIAVAAVLLIKRRGL